MRAIRIATRKSPLALAQTRKAISLLRSFYPDREFVVVALTSTGDDDFRPLHSFSEVGVFVKTLENALLNREADCALHCLKDLPAPLSEEFSLPCYLPREEVVDVLVCKKSNDKSHGKKHSDQEILAGITEVSTGSLRRRAFLGQHYPSWNFADLRGNVNTRLKKLIDNRVEAIVLAQVGVRRLRDHYRDSAMGGETIEGSEFLRYFEQLQWISIPTSLLLPSPGQGVLVFQCNADDEDMISLLHPLNHPLTESMSVLEREVMMKVEGGCRTPLGVWARVRGGEAGMEEVSIEAAMMKDGIIVRGEERGLLGRGELMGKAHRLADYLLESSLDHKVD